MIIGIDGNEANTKEKVGVHQYAYELLHSFYRICKNQKLQLRFLIYLKEPPSADLPTENEYWKYIVIPGEGLWILRRLMPALLTNSTIDVFFSPSHYLPFLYRTPQVCTIHDLGYLEYSEQFKKKDYWQLKYWSAISIFTSKKIIAVSESTKKEIVRHYPRASNKTSVVYHGYDNKRFNINIYAKNVRHILRKYNISKNYMLFIGMLKPSKNIPGLLQAFKIIKELGCDYQLVIAGKKGWLYEDIFKKVIKEGLVDDVVFTDYLAEEDKPGLIRGAKLLVSPSYWEGFGMQVLEAMACGVPAVVSNVASLPEVAGEAGIYVDPNNAKSIAKGVKKVLDMSKTEYNMLVKSCLDQASKFSWVKTGRETLDILINEGKR